MSEENGVSGTEVAKLGFWALLIGGASYGLYRVINYFTKPSMPEDVRALVEEIQAKLVAQDARDNQTITDGGATEADYEFDAWLQEDINQEWQELVILVESYPDSSPIWEAVTDTFVTLIKTGGIWFQVAGSLAATYIAFRSVKGFRSWYQGWRKKKFEVRPPYNQNPPPPIDPHGGIRPPIQPGPPPPAPCPVCHIIFDSPEALANHIASGVHPVTANTVTLEEAQLYFNQAPEPIRGAIYAEATEWGVAGSIEQYWPSLAAGTMLLMLAAVAVVCTAGASSPLVPLVYENAFAGSNTLMLNTVARALVFA